MQVQGLSDPDDPDSEVITVASKHTLVNVVPARQQRHRRPPGNRRRGGGGSGSGRRRHSNEQRRPLDSGSPGADPALTQSLRGASADYSEDEDGSVTLGPVSERFVMVRQGVNVVLECRDADADSRVYWTKHGGKWSVVL